jgi:hypothetical protein
MMTFFRSMLRSALLLTLSATLLPAALVAQSGSGAQQQGAGAMGGQSANQSLAPYYNAASAPPAAKAPTPTPQMLHTSAPLVDDLWLAHQFGPSFKLDPKISQMTGDFFGDGHEALAVVANSKTPLLSSADYHYKVVDPYDGYFGTGSVKITSTFTLHFDGSARCVLIINDWRHLSSPKSAKEKDREEQKYVIINTPFETISAVNLSLKKKKKNISALETVDYTTLHSLVFFDGKRWRWYAQGMDGDESLTKMPSEN